MQQTQKYKLNLIERDDPFLPDALNANTQKVEDAMTAHEAAVEARMDATDQRVTVLEAHKFACGTYTGTYTGGTSGSLEQTIHLPFTPRVVYVHKVLNNDCYMCTDTDGNGYPYLSIVEGGFKASSIFNSNRLNFIAFA